MARIDARRRRILLRLCPVVVVATALFSPLVRAGTTDFAAIDELLVRHEIEKARGALEERVRKGDAEAMFRLASLHRSSSSLADASEARRLYLEAAELGHVDAMYMAAQCQERGIGGERDIDAARHWYSAASARGDPRATERLASIGTAASDPFEAIVRERDERRLRSTLEGADLGPRPADGKTLLIVAAEAGATGALAILLERRAEPNAQDRSGRSALHYAARAGHRTIVERLLAAGGRPDLRDGNGDSPLHLAAATGDTRIVSALLGAGAVPSATNARGWSARDVAARKGDRATVQLLGAPVGSPSKPAALQNTRLGTLRRDPRFGGWSDLAIAAWHGDRTLVAGLLGTNDPNAPDTAGRTPLYWAVECGHIDVVKDLLAAGANPNRAPPKAGNLLHVAIDHDHLAAIQPLIDRGIALDTPNAAGESPLFFAARRNRLDTVRTLLDAGADVDATTRNGRTALMSATDAGAIETAQLLIEHRANAALRDAAGRNALWYAAGTGKPALVRALLSPNDLTADAAGTTALHRAAMADDLETLELLLDAGARVDATTNAGTTALSTAAAMGKEMLVRSLLARGANPNTRDRHGNTPLHHAVAGGHLEVAQQLLRAGATPNIRNDNDLSAAQLIRQHSDPGWDDLL